MAPAARPGRVRRRSPRGFRPHRPLRSNAAVANRRLGRPCYGPRRSIRPTARHREAPRRARVVATITIIIDVVRRASAFLRVPRHQGRRRRRRLASRRPRRRRARLRRRRLRPHLALRPRLRPHRPRFPRISSRGRRDRSPFLFNRSLASSLPRLALRPARSIAALGPSRRCRPRAQLEASRRESRARARRRAPSSRARRDIIAPRVVAPCARATRRRRSRIRRRRARHRRSRPGARDAS